MKKHISSIVLICKLFFYTYLFVIFIDLIGFRLGNNTFVLHYHSLLLNIAIVVLIIAILNIIVMYIDLVSKQKWVNILLISIIIGIFFTANYMLTPVIQKINIEKAYDTIYQNFNDKTTKLEITFSNNHIRDMYNSFTKYYDKSAITLTYYSAFYDEYVFLVKLKSNKSFNINMKRLYRKKTFTITATNNDLELKDF